MRRVTLLKTVLTVFILVVALVGCDILFGPTPGDAGRIEDDEDNGTQVETVDPPDNLVGTIALSNGTSAVLDVTFSATSSPSATLESSAIGTQALYTVGGFIRYAEQDFAVSGVYDSETAILGVTATNNAIGTFSVNGIYDAADGFSGTVAFTDLDETTVTGSVSAVGVASGDQATVSIFIGTYGGTAYGSWNGTLTATRFYGTWAASDGTGDSGTFSGTRSGGSVSGLAAGAYGEQVPFGGALSASGDSIGGWYAGDVVEDGESYPVSGTWVGVKVDANKDAPAVNASSEQELVLNRVLQAIGNLFQKATAVAAEGAGDFETVGDDHFVTVEVGSPDVTVTLSAIYDGPVSVETFVGWAGALATLTGDGFTDPVTGLTIGAGEILTDFETSLTFSIRDTDALVVDSEVQIESDTQDDGVTVTFSDDSTVVLYFNGTIDSNSGTVGGIWEYGSSIDVLADVAGVVQDILF